MSGVPGGVGSSDASVEALADSVIPLLVTGCVSEATLPVVVGMGIGFLDGNGVADDFSEETDAEPTATGAGVLGTGVSEASTIIDGTGLFRTCLGDGIDDATGDGAVVADTLGAVIIGDDGVSLGDWRSNDVCGEAAGKEVRGKGDVGGTGFTGSP